MTKTVSSLALTFLLILAVGLAPTAQAGEDAPATTPASEAAPAAVAATPAPDASDKAPIALADLELLPVAQPQSCSEVCGSYFAPNHGDCNDIGCYGIGCGAPNGWDFSTCYCYCSYCF